MIKKLGLVLLAALIFFIGSVNTSFATTSSSEPVNQPEGSTEFQSVPLETDSSDPLGAPAVDEPQGAISFAGGYISCLTYSNIGECNWTIKAPERITYSNVKVTLERWDGFLSGGWNYYTSKSFVYPVNISTTTIRNQANFSLPKGKYRAKLGGTFTTIKSIYSPVASDPSVFEIK